MRRVLILLLTTCVASAQHPSTDEGRRLFVKNCSACHGDTGKGGRAPDLTGGQWKHGASDDDLRRNITKGIAGTQMPAFLLNDADTAAVIAFLPSLHVKKQPPKADGSVGRALFLGEAGCSASPQSGGGWRGPGGRRTRRARRN